MSKKTKRWGKKYNDRRNWKKYNEKLVKRGEFYINPAFLETWLRETEEMNRGKVGQPYLYPNSLIEFAAILHAKGFDYRSTNGILKGLSGLVGVSFPVISYSQICRRVNALDIKFGVHGSDLIVGCDGSGMKVSNRGDWIRKTWKVKRGWIKVVVMGSLDGKTVDIRVGNEKLDERKAARGMIGKKNVGAVGKVLLDGLHDCRDTFNLCSGRDIEPVINIRKNASTRARGSIARKKRVIEYKKLGYKKWAKINSYGLRWVCTEGIFSAVKRIFGEGVRSSKKRNMYLETKMKFWAYNRLLEVT